MTKKNRLSSRKPDTTRRDFLTLTAGAVGTIGAVTALWPFLNSMNPAEDVLATAQVDVDLKEIPEGQTKNYYVAWKTRFYSS